MRGVIFGVLICIACLLSSACVRLGPEPSVHPHSAVTVPTFCLYDGDAPQSIVSIHVVRRSKDDDERIDIMEWSSKTPWAAADQMAWKIEYAPDSEAQTLQRPFSCITYGKAPPGYIETTPALPLIPERLYTVFMGDNSKRSARLVLFIIRSSDTGSPVKLEYSIDPIHYHGVRIINNRGGTDQ